MNFKYTILFILFIITCIDCSIIFNPLDNTTFKVHTPKFRHTSLQSWVPFTTAIVPVGLTLKDLQACDKIKAPYPITGLAVLMIPQGCSVEKHAELAKRSNVSAVFFLAGNAADFLAVIKDDNNHYVKNVPILMLNTNDTLRVFAEMTKNIRFNSTLPILVTVIEDDNIWMKLTGGWGMIFFQVVIEIVMLVTLAFGVKGQITFAREQGLKPTAAQLCIFFNNLALICLIIFVIDMFAIRRWYVFGLFMVPTFLAITFLQISSMSLAYFFQELLLTKRISYPGLSYFKIPFIVTSILLFTIYIIFCILYCLYMNSNEVVKSVLFIAAGIFSVLIIFFSIGGIMVLKSMKKFKKKMVIRVSITVFISVMGMLFLLVCLLVFGVIAPMDENGLLAFAILLTISELMVIIPQVFTFKHPSMLKSMATKSKESVNNKKSDMSSEFKEEVSLGDSGYGNLKEGN